MSSPSFVPSRNEIWYSDGFQGFFAVRLTNGAWNSPEASPSGGTAGSSLRCFRATSTLAAGPRKTLGTSGADVIVGGKAAEKFRTKGGADRVCARRGRDVLRGGKGRDRLRGGKGNDRLIGGPGRDLLACGKGRKDVVVAGPRDKVRGGCEVKRLGR
jgi:Ca2+-binding RTX toxin-like protein